MLKNAPGERRFFIQLLLAGLVFPPGLLVYACYLLLSSARDGDLTMDRLAVGLFLMGVALLGCVAWAGALVAIFGD
jgi:hypothetical protein